MSRWIGIALVCFVHIAIAEDAVVVAEKKYAAAVEQAKKDYATALKAEMTRLTKAGDLDSALKVRDKILALGLEKSEVKQSDAKPNENGQLPGWVLAAYGGGKVEVTIFKNPTAKEKVDVQESEIIHGLLLIPAGKEVVRVRCGGTEVPYKAACTGDNTTSRQAGAWLLIKTKVPAQPTVAEIKWTLPWKGYWDSNFFEWNFTEKEEMGWVAIPDDAMVHTEAIKAKYEKK